MGVAKVGLVMLYIDVFDTYGYEGSVSDSDAYSSIPSPIFSVQNTRTCQYDDTVTCIVAQTFSDTISYSLLKKKE